jgi:uncharacterized SAM-binding protein YcdF (DUF218 family)
LQTLHSRSVVKEIINPDHESRTGRLFPMSKFSRFVVAGTHVLVFIARWIGHIAKLVILAAILWGAGFVVFAEMITDEPSGITGEAEGIVALTGGEARVAAAIGLLSEGKAKRLLISGVNPSTTREQLVHLNPQSAKLFRCCIDLDWNAQDTIGNAEETAGWTRRMHFKSLIVVTSSYHMPRSLVELRRELPDVDLIPYPVKPRAFEGGEWWTHPAGLRLLLSEYIKMFPALARFAASRLDSHRPGTAKAGAMYTE